jgi:hypothetical protein
MIAWPENAWGEEKGALGQRHPYTRVNHAHGPAMQRPVFAVWMQNDFDIDSKPAEQHKESIDGEARIAPMHELGDIGLANTEPLSCVCVGEPYGLNAVVDVPCQLRLYL